MAQAEWAREMEAQGAVIREMDMMPKNVRMPLDPASVDATDAHATMGVITLEAGQNLILEVRFGDVYY